jgi:hypothetical protein
LLQLPNFYSASIFGRFNKKELTKMGYDIQY